MSERIKKWPGVELSAADLNEGKVTQTRFRPNAKYAWSAGEAMSRFLAELQNGRLIARTCHSCSMPRISRAESNSTDPDGNNWGLPK